MPLRALLDLLYPRACAHCGRPDPDAGRYLCWDCMARVDFVQPPFCELCGDPVGGRVGHAYRCALCSARAVHFDAARSVARYDGVVGALIRDLKYRGAFWLAPDLADWLAAGVRAHFDSVPFDAIAAVPLHASKQRARGYNQSALLAARLGKRLGLPLAHRCLRRIRADCSQTHLTVSERAANVAGAFDTRWNRWLEGRRILLVDDVMTTGATVNDCARALKAGGASTVRVITLARG